MNRVKAFALLFLVLWPTSVAAVDPELALRGVIKQIVQRLEMQPEQRVAGEILFMPAELLAFYTERDYYPGWRIHTATGREQARIFLERLQTLRDEGLCSGDYHLGYFRTLLNDLAVADRETFFDEPRWRGWDDVLLTDALMHYLHHLIEGRVPPDNVQDGWMLRKKPVELAEMVDEALDQEHMAQVLHKLQPGERGYQRLLEALAWYRELSDKGGWPKIPSGPSLHADQPDPRLPLLRIRLMLSHDLDDLPLNAPPKMLSEDIAALKRFQRRHGLKPDGVLGDETLAALNVPVAVRLRQIELNLERWRWLPKQLGRRYLLVNIADFRVSVVEDGKTVLEMPAVVGNSYRKTPVFSASMSYLEFAPYWYVPPTILKEDKLPEIRRDPGYLARHHYEVVGWDGTTPLDPTAIDWQGVDEENFPGLLRQKPGPWNALGRVKFMLPNAHAVYLHDTPDRRLFWQRQRSFSSGCIRVEKPLELASYLLAEQGWSRADVRAAMHGDAPLRVDLERRLPVHVLYWTAWVDEDGLLHFRDDVYGRDVDLDIALARELSTCPARPVALPSPEVRNEAVVSERKEP